MKIDNELIESLKTCEHLSDEELEKMTGGKYADKSIFTKIACPWCGNHRDNEYLPIKHEKYDGICRCSNCRKPYWKRSNMGYKMN